MKRIPTALELKLGPTGRRYESKSKLVSLQPGFILGWRTSKGYRYPIIRVCAYNFLPKTFGLQGDLKTTVTEAIRLWRTRRRENFTMSFDDAMRHVQEHAAQILQATEAA